jgi:hypothetical protein
MSRILSSALALTGGGERPMHYIIRDWTRWTRGERIGAIAIITAFAVLYGLLLA